MKTAWSMLAAVALLFAFTVAVSAEDKDKAEAKKVTLKGTITCAKCDLKLEAKCATVIKSGDKVYYFDDVSGKKYHKQICTEAKKGSVTGTVSKKGDKMIITVTELKFE
jgi:polyribonucleotide nucleotidyltransferase